MSTASSIIGSTGGRATIRLASPTTSGCWTTPRPWPVIVREYGRRSCTPTPATAAATMRSSRSRCGSTSGSPSCTRSAACSRPSGRPTPCSPSGASCTPAGWRRRRASCATSMASSPISEALADELASTRHPARTDHDRPQRHRPRRPRRPAARPRAARELGLDGRFVVGYLGNLDHWREGIDVLIAAHRRAPRARGRRRRRAARRRRRHAAARRSSARRSGLGLTDASASRVACRTSEVAQSYVQMDLFANPRVDERAARFITPLKPYEAMALGIPVLVSDLPALREIVDPPHRGVVAPPGDPVALATASRPSSTTRLAGGAVGGRSGVGPPGAHLGRQRPAIPRGLRGDPRPAGLRIGGGGRRAWPQRPAPANPTPLPSGPWTTAPSRSGSGTPATT